MSAVDQSVWVLLVSGYDILLMPFVQFILQYVWRASNEAPFTLRTSPYVHYVNVRRRTLT